MNHIADHFHRESSLPAPAAGAPPATEEEPKKKREYKGFEEKHEGDKHVKVDMNTVSTTTLVIGTAVPLFGFPPGLCFNFWVDIKPGVT